jgi:hypothetical protein
LDLVEGDMDVGLVRLDDGDVVDEGGHEQLQLLKGDGMVVAHCCCRLREG